MMDQVTSSRGGQHLDQSALAGDPQTDEALFVVLLQLLRDVLAFAALVIAGSGTSRQEGNVGSHQAGGNVRATFAALNAGSTARTPTPSAERAAACKRGALVSC